jgi:hypothetical protein
MLIALGGSPDWKLVYWNWDKMKVTATVSASNAAGSPVHLCSFSPEDDTQVCVTGNGIFKLYKITDGVFKSVSQSIGKRELQVCLPEQGWFLQWSYAFPAIELSLAYVVVA